MTFPRRNSCQLILWIFTFFLLFWGTWNYLDFSQFFLFACWRIIYHSEKFNSLFSFDDEICFYRCVCCFFLFYYCCLFLSVIHFHCSVSVFAELGFRIVSKKLACQGPGQIHLLYECVLLLKNVSIVVCTVFILAVYHLRSVSGVSD